MSPNAPTPSSESRAFSVPGKTFVLGEYAVLAGSPALVATIAPRFALSELAGGAAGSADFHPASPAGRLLARARAAGVAAAGRSFSFADPYLGQGGFGASTAQFALLYRALAAEAGWDLDVSSVWRAYRELMRDEPVPPSGADLAAQWHGGIPRIETRTDHVRVEEAGPAHREALASLLIFSAAGQEGRKVRTHEHLAALAREGAAVAPELRRRLDAVLDRAWVAADAPALGRALGEYASVLSEAGLEVAAARADREAFERLPGVLGAKGSGAMLADAVVVLLEPGAAGKADVIAAARTRGLRLIADGVRGEAGVGLPEPEARPVQGAGA